MIEEVIKKDIDFVDDSYKDLLKKVTSKEIDEIEKLNTFYDIFIC